MTIAGLDPFIIHEDLGKGRFRVKTSAGKPLKQTIHCARLKLYHDPASGPADPPVPDPAERPVPGPANSAVKPPVDPDDNPVESPIQPPVDDPDDVPMNRKRKRATQEDMNSKKKRVRGSKVPKRKCTQEMKEILKNGEWLTDEHILLSHAGVTQHPISSDRWASITTLS